MDDKAVLVSPNVLLPKDNLQLSPSVDAGIIKPWDDGKKWHLQERCSTKTAPIMQSFADKIPAIVTIEGISWNQKHYVAFRLHGRNWLTVETRPSLLYVIIRVVQSSFELKGVAKLLGIEVFDHSKPLADKLDTPSSVQIERRENFDMVCIRIKPDFNLSSEGFVEFIKQAHKTAVS